jgi:hypothetical protein
MVLVSALNPPETFVCIKLLYVLKPLKINSYVTLRTFSALSEEGHQGIAVNTESEAIPSS